MAKPDFKMIDISMKITNKLPVIRITEDITVTVNNRKSNVLNIQAMAKEAENKASQSDDTYDQLAFINKALSMLVGETGSKAIDDLDLPMPEYKMVYETIMSVATGEYGEPETPTK